MKLAIVGIRVKSKNLKRWFEQQAKHIKLKNQKEIFWFISGLIDSEGSVKSNNPPSKTNMVISITQKKKALLTIAKKMLKQVGIHSNLIKEKKCFKLLIYGKPTFERLLSQGNIQEDSKRARLVYAISNGRAKVEVKK